MKNTIKLLAILTISVAAFACTQNEAPNQSISTKTAEKQLYKSVGVIKKIDAESGKLTIDHEDIPGYMTAMEMNEAVSDKKMLEAIKIGDKVEFEIERTGSALLITKLTKIGEVSLVNAPEIYKTSCAECHGANGEGTKKGIPFTSGHALQHSEAEFIEQVTNGEGGKMPAFKDKLSAEQIAAVVKFVRDEIQKDAKRSGKEPHKH